MRFEPEAIMKAENEGLMSRAASLGSLGGVARQQGEDPAAEAHFRDALGLALKAASQTTAGGSHHGRTDA